MDFSKIVGAVYPPLESGGWHPLHPCPTTPGQTESHFGPQVLRHGAPVQLIPNLGV